MISNTIVFKEIIKTGGDRDSSSVSDRKGLIDYQNQRSDGIRIWILYSILINAKASDINLS